MIKTKEDFKNCYIDLSNKELNGEMTEERYKRLFDCLFNLNFNEFLICNTWGWVKTSKEYLLYGIRDYELKSYYRDYNREKYIEVSVHDILGFDEEEEKEEDLAGKWIYKKGISKIFEDIEGMQEAKEEPLSDCCHAPIKVSYCDVCTKCGEPCSIEEEPTEEELSYITQSFDGTGYMIGMNKESIQITSKNFQSIKAFLEGEKEGNKIIGRVEYELHHGWCPNYKCEAKLIPQANIFICPVCEKQYELDLVEKTYKMKLFDSTIKDIEKARELYKDKEEPKKTMTLENAIREKKIFIYRDNKYQYRDNQVFDTADNNPKDGKWRLALTEIMENINVKVEIIEEE